MTTTAEDAAVEDAFEAYLSGRAVPDAAAGSFPAIAAFGDAVRSTAAHPGRPAAALAELLVTGRLTDQLSPSSRTAGSAGQPPRKAPVRRRRRFTMFLPALIAKFLSAGAIAQVATGAGVALAAFTGAGAAGVLPGSVQDAFSSVVGTASSGTTTAAADATSTEATATATSPEATATATATPTETSEASATTTETSTAPVLSREDWKKGPAEDQSFGKWVSSGARLGYADGKVISEWAHKKHEQWPVRTTAPAAPTTEAGDDSAEAPGTKRQERGRQQSRVETDRAGGQAGNGRHGGHGNG